MEVGLEQEKDWPTNEEEEPETKPAVKVEPKAEPQDLVLL
jgi:hypothetical protein